MFLIFSNGLPFENHCLFYEDDIRTWRALKFLEDSYRLHADIKSVKEYTQVKGMPLNVKKCTKIRLRTSATQTVSYLLCDDKPSGANTHSNGKTGYDGELLR
uniref:Uncharacterized protein n=1 Tax=Trichobilharzia regenti TaxID=157069 RepID=A0AA85K5P0_TRIRE|nr:unnamed protein product [Trichobilharzia regenti]